MKKRKNPNKIDCVPVQNPVAKFAHQFNKAHIFEDKNKYRRKAKHRKQEASPMTLVRIIREASCILDILIPNQEIGNSLKSSAGLMKLAI
jgi:hypothetical protein